MRINMCRRPQTHTHTDTHTHTHTHTQIKQTYMRFLWFISFSFFFYPSTNFKIWCRPHTGMACETWKGYHIRTARRVVPKTEKDVDVLQSAKNLTRHKSQYIFKSFIRRKKLR